MHRIFESFVRRFAACHCPGTKVLAMKIKWHGDWTDDMNEYLPSMHTDVTLIRADRRTILDCKFYEEALTTRHGRHRLHTSDLFQLMAYLRNKSIDDGWQSVDGILSIQRSNIALTLNSLSGTTK